jgi:hypothetical protein
MDQTPTSKPTFRNIHSKLNFLTNVPKRRLGLRADVDVDQSLDLYHGQVIALERRRRARIGASPRM